MNWLITFSLIAILIIMIVGGAYLIAKRGAINAKRYNEYTKKYNRINDIIDDKKRSVCDQNYDWILRLLENLGKCKYKDKKSTEDLTMKFFRKYEDIAKKRVNEND